MILTDTQLRGIVLEVLSESSSTTQGQANPELENEVYIPVNLNDSIHGKFKAEILYVRDEKKYYVTDWPHPANKKGEEYSHSTERNAGEIASRENPIELSVDNFCYEPAAIIDVKNIVRNRLPEVEVPKAAHRKQYDPSLGYPVVVVNNASSKPIASNYFKSLKRASEYEDLPVPFRAYVKAIYDAAPEGHGCLVVIEPGTARPKLVNFGLYDEKAGGHPECASQLLMGSVIVRDLGGMPVSLTKTKNSAGEEYYTFEDAYDAITNIFSRAGFPKIPFASADITKVDNCKYSSKALTVARRSRCVPYNILPGIGVMDLFSSASPLGQAYRKYIAGTEFDTELEKAGRSDNCSTLAYKILSVAKTGKVSSGDTSLVRLPSNLISAVNRDFNFV